MAMLNLLMGDREPSPLEMAGSRGTDGKFIAIMG